MAKAESRKTSQATQKPGGRTPAARTAKASRPKPAGLGVQSKTASILAIGCYIPRTRIERKTIADVWGGPIVPGERALAGADEDAVTMAVEAVQNCLGDYDRSAIDAVYFASTSAPYVERQGASIIAAATGMREDIATADFGDTLRAGTAAVRAARDAVLSGSARNVLVVASDRRVAEPETAFEQVFGDGAAAVLVGRNESAALADIQTIVSFAENVTAGWRRTEDRFVRSFNARHEIDFGYAAPLVRALTEVVKETGLDPARARLAVPSPDGRAHFKVARAVGIPQDRVADPLILAIGVLGTPAPIVALVGALQSARVGETVLLGAAGEGADGLALRVRSQLPAQGWKPSSIFQDRRVVSSYGDFIRANRLMELPGPVIMSSPVQYWRDRAQNLCLQGMRCTSCGLVQYPVGRICQRCKAKDQRNEILLSRRGKVFTYTLDNLVAATYSTIPVVRAIVDLEGGGRILTQVTDCEPSSAFVGMPVELTFRRMNDGGNFKNYYWKARPAADAGRAKEGAA